LGNRGQVNLIACRFYKKPVHLLKPARDTRADRRIALSGVGDCRRGALLRKPDPQSGFMERASAATCSRLWENIPCLEKIKLSNGEYQQLGDPELLVAGASSKERIFTP
jgi:hypothetical protein